MNTIFSVYPPTKEISNDLINAMEKAIDKFQEYKDLTTYIGRYKTFLDAKKSSLPSEQEIIGEKQEKLEKEKSLSKEKKKKRERSRDREKRREDNSRTPDVRKRSPDDYKQSKKQKK